MFQPIHPYLARSPSVPTWCWALGQAWFILFLGAELGCLLDLFCGLRVFGMYSREHGCVGLWAPRQAFHKEGPLGNTDGLVEGWTLWVRGRRGPTGRRREEGDVQLRVLLLDRGLCACVSRTPQLPPSSAYGPLLTSPPPASPKDGPGADCVQCLSANSGGRKH